MRIAIAVTALALVAAPLVAQEPAAAPKRGATLRDAKAVRLGTIDRVNADGSVQIIFNTRFVTIPADKLVVTPNAVTTSLTKAEISRMR